MDTKPISKLRSLNLAYCNRINWSSVEALGALPYLVSLDLTHWLQMTSLEWTALLKITQLRTLVLNGVPMIPLHDICGALTNLTHLEAGMLLFDVLLIKIDHSSWDASSRLSDLTNLSMLSLGCTAPQKLPDIFHLFTNLKELSLRGFEFDPVEHIQFVSALSGMYKLHLMDCALTNNLVYPILSSLPLLVDVSLDGSKVSGNNETSAKTFSELEDEHRCPDTVLPAITDGLPYLHSLNLKTKHWLLDSIDMLSLTAPTAPELWRFSCRMTEDAIPVLSALVHLNYLDISSSPLCINDVIAGVTSLVSLRTLIMRNLHYDGEANLQPLSTLTNLTELNMLTDDYRSGIVDSSTIRHIPSLICLAVPSFNREADWTSHLRKHRKLKILWVSTMPRTNLEVLTKLTGLRTRHRWKYYNAREKEWKSNPHDLIDFPIH